MKVKFVDKFNTTLSWKTKVKVVAFYHQLKVLQDKDWTIRKTANYFNVSIGLISENLLISKHLDKLDEKCNSRNKALQLIRKRYN